MLYELPQELLTKIYEFDRTYHLDYLRCLDKILLIGYLNKLSLLDKEYQTRAMSGEYIIYSDLVNEYFPDSEKAIAVFNNCNCCHRHQIKKPTNLSDLNGTSSYIDIPGQGWANREYNWNVDHECECKCRNLCRWICRANGTLDF